MKKTNCSRRRIRLKKNEELMREHKYLKDKILKMQKELKDRSDIEDKFNQDIEELSQDTEDLAER